MKRIIILLCLLISSVTLAGTLNLTNDVVKVSTPTEDNHAANKAYVDLYAGPENDPIAATNNVKHSDTNGWIVSSHAGFSTNVFASPVNTTVSYSGTTSTLAVTKWQTLVVTNDVTLLWEGTTADDYAGYFDVQSYSVTWPTNWTWLLDGPPDGTNIVVSWFPKTTSGWYAIGGGN